MNLDAIPVIDVHCHPFPTTLGAITEQQFLDALGVSLRGDAAAENRSMLLVRMAVKALARLLDCEPTIERVLEVRNALAEPDPVAWNAKLFGDAKIAAVFIDPGYPLELLIKTDAFRAVVPCAVYEGYRIERFINGQLGLGANTSKYGSFTDLVDDFRATLDQEAADPNIRFYKTVIAYMSGLAIHKVSEAEASQAWRDTVAGTRDAHKTVRDYLFWETALKAKEHNLPFQVHTGHTSHINVWPNVNPILMTPILNEPEMQDVNFVLVHGGYPYNTEAGYITSVYPKISLDLSLMIPWSSIGIASRIEQTLESAPTSKIMYGSDGIMIPELYWISALNTRRALGRVLDRLIDEEVLNPDEALDVGRDILYRNAERIYGISIGA